MAFCWNVVAHARTRRAPWRPHHCVSFNRSSIGPLCIASRGGEDGRVRAGKGSRSHRTRTGVMES